MRFPEGCKTFPSQIQQVVLSELENLLLSNPVKEMHFFFQEYKWFYLQ